MNVDMSVARRGFPITHQGVFLNHAATSPLSRRTLNRLSRAVEEMAEPLGKHFYASLGVLEETRRMLAELINAHASEIAFSSNTSTSLSLIASAVPFERGDRVLVPDNEFPSNLYVWQNLRDRGVTCELFTPNPGEPLVETLRRQDLSRVRLISVSAVSFETGRQYEWEAFTAFCRERGIYSCLDAIQAIGAMPFDVKAIGVDFMASGAQKWLLGPVGCGFLYARRELLERLRVPYVGWTSVRYPENFSIKELDFAPEMTRFEPGLPNILPIVGLNESLRELSGYGFPWIFERVRTRSDRLRAELTDRGMKLLTTGSDHLTPIVSHYLPEGSDHRRTQDAFHKAGVSVTVRENYVRVSPHFYTEDAEIDAYLKALDGIVARPRLAVTRNVIEAPQPIQTNNEGPGRVLIGGATGILGGEIATRLAGRGYSLTLLARDGAALDKMAREFRERHRVDVTTRVVDYRDVQALERLLDEMARSTERFVGVVHAAAAVTVDPMARIEADDLRAMFDVNVLAPTRLTRAFLTTLRAPGAFGVLQLIPGSARCGFPLMGGFGGSFGALWTIGEAIDRECRHEGIRVTNFVSAPIHSRLQKRIGRVALRYFKMGGSFDFDHPDQVAERAVRAFLERRPLVIGWGNRIQNMMNTLWPARIDARIAARWRV